MHHKEKCSAGKLVSGAFEGVIVILGQFPQNAWRESFWGAGRGVVVLVAFQLIQ
jgi:hypothetical protein